MSFFDFDNLIDQYSRTFTVQTEQAGHYDDMGDWVSGGMDETEREGAIIGFAERKLYREGGTLTANDKHLFMLSPIDRPLKNAHVVFNGNRYKIEEEKMKDNAEFTGVFSYLLKWVSAFG